MKMNEAVLNRVYKYRWRRGITVADTDGSIYKAFKTTYLLSLIWLFATNFLYILGSLLSFYDSVTDNDVLMLPFVLIVGATVCTAIGTILILKFKVHIIGSILNLASFFVLSYEFYQLLVSLNMPHPLNSQFWFRHGVPCLISALCCIVMCVIAVRAKILLKKEYKRVLEIIYTNNRDKLANAIEEDWERFLDELEDSDISENT